jgi:DNA-binding protein HU-beta
MNKAELIAAVAAEADISKTDAAKAVDAITTVISGSLQKGDEVSLVGFGRFYLKKSEERKGRNPKTGEEIIIPASNHVKFKAGKTLTDACN